MVISNHGNGDLAGFQFIPQISAGGVTTFCKGGSVLLTSTAAANNQWYKDGIAVGGATGGTFSADANGVYTVKTMSNGITTSSVSGIPVTAITVATPVITRNVNNDLLSSDTAGNQWYFSGTAIPGATNQLLTPAQSGSYTVKATVNGCVSDLSAPYTVALTGLINLGNGQYVNLYPNPVSKQININWNINGMPPLDIEITDFQGRKMLMLPNALNGTVVDLSGLYTIRIYSDRSYKINKTIRILKVD
jgi:hypothetical protein